MAWVSAPTGVSASTDVGQAETPAAYPHPSAKLKGQKSSENIKGVTTPRCRLYGTALIRESKAQQGQGRVWGPALLPYPQGLAAMEGCSQLG